MDKEILTNLYIFRSLPLQFDSRTQRYKFFFESKMQVIYFTLENFTSKKNIRNIFKYIVFLLKCFLFSLYSIRGNDKAICIDLDTFIPVFMGSFWKKNIVIYFDIADPLSETKFRNFPNFVRKFIDYLEYAILLKRDYNILPADYRKLYYQDKLGKDVSRLKFKIIENVPVFNDTKINNKNYPINKHHIVIGYFGALEKERGILEFIEFFRNHEGFLFIIAGRGSLLDYCIKNSDNLKIKFLGSYNAVELPYLYSLVDFTLAYYQNDSKYIHYYYACPNKYYEHIIFETPIIVNKGIYISKLISESRTGIIIDDILNPSTFEKLVNEIRNFKYDKNKFINLKNKYLNYKEYVNKEISL